MATTTKDYGIIGKKIGMTQVFDEEGNVVPVTVIELAENIVTDIKTEAKDGYNAVQVGAFKAKEKHLTKADKNRFEKNGTELFRKTKEFRCHEAIEDLKIGDQINYEDFFKDLVKVNITGTSIGKGFQGGVKLHNMHVGRRSHGSKSKRQIGSIGAGTDPSRVMKGKRMPAMMGNRTVTQMKAKVFKYDAEKNLVLIKGAVPGKPGNTLFIKANGARSWNNYNK
jgi:large subunit ribosomal protein L3